DLGAIAKADVIALTAPMIVEADDTPNAGGWPRGGQTVVRFRNEHLQYAITWFGLALVLMVVYVAYHVSHGRLDLRRYPAGMVEFPRFPRGLGTCLTAAKKWTF